MNEFELEVRERVSANSSDETLRATAAAFMKASAAAKYSYNFSALGRPIIQYPQDMVAIQELVWRVRPDLILETGIAHGGSLILSASMLALLDYCDAVESGALLDPRTSHRKAIGIDVDIRAHNRDAINAHPLSGRIEMVQGSSIDPDVIASVRQRVSGAQRVLVFLDSNHTHDHVLAELEAYAPLVTPESYCVVFDTLVEDLPADVSAGRAWGHGNNPKTALHEYLRILESSGRSAADGAPLKFEIDKSIDNKLVLTVAPDGYLKRVV